MREMVQAQSPERKIEARKTFFSSPEGILFENADCVRY
jgi:hypothetical protein